MREAFKYLTSVLFLAIVIQVGLAGYGAFHAIDKAGKSGPITKKTIENGFDLTGPIARGDLATVEAHERAIRAAQPELEHLYETLAEATVTLA